jgi:hypothetical protein
MKITKINITEPYKITVVPTEMRYSLNRDMFHNDGQKYCEIFYEILAGKYVKVQPKLDEAGLPILKSGKPVTEEVLIDFSNPILYHSATKVIDFALYLLIEQYRATKSEELLAQINGVLSQFVFENSLANLTLSITDAE